MLGRPQAAQLLIFWSMHRPDRTCWSSSGRVLTATISAATTADVESLDAAYSLAGAVEPVAGDDYCGQYDQAVHWISPGLKALCVSGGDLSLV